MNRQLKVGVFVLIGLALLGLGIFLIGDSRRLWESKIDYRAAFHDVSGLRAGAPVRSGGIDIGTVTSVGHSNNPNDTLIYVTISVVKAEAPRIRDTSVAKVANKGLLGDKMVEISVADPQDPPQDPKELLKSEDPHDMLANADALAGRVRKIVENLEPLSKQLGDGELGKNIKASADALRGSSESLKQIMEAVATQDSIAHKVLFDPEQGRNFKTVMANLAQASGHVNGILNDVHQLTTQARDKRGLVGAMLYDEQIKDNVAGTIANVRKSTDAVVDPQSRGLVHAALYGDESSKGMMANLNKMSEDLAAIVSGIRQGKGTIGALLVDPTVYEDIKSAIGNVERNQVLRALVRYSIKADEARPQVETPRVPVQSAQH